MRPTLVAMNLALLLVVAPWGSAYAHHILGVPHYSYDEDYPQTPVLSYRASVGDYDVKMTGYPGKLLPGQRCSIHLYIHRKSNGELLDAPVTMVVSRDRQFFADTVVYGPMVGRLDERIYKFHPRFEHESNYLVRVEFEADGTPWTIDLPMVVGEPQSPTLVLAGSFALLAVLVVTVRAVRIKRGRRTGTG